MPETDVSAMLEVRNLTVCVKRHGNAHKVLDGVNFSINEGEIIALAGESGCGKSMTALSILKLLPETVEVQSGEIIFNGQNLINLNKKDLNQIRGSGISMIFQEARQSLNPLMRIGSQIMESLELSAKNKKEIKNKKKQYKKNKERVLGMLEALSFDEVVKIFDAYPHQLSGGMCQRVMTAIAAINRPRLLLADEPSSSLDNESQERILSLITEMNSKYNTSVLIISHDLSIIQKFCRRFFVMYAGRIVEEGPAEALFSPLHPYTKALVGAIPGKNKRGIPLENINGKVPSIEDHFSGCPFAPRCVKVQSKCKDAFPPAKFIKNSKVYCYYTEGNYEIQ